MNEIKTYNKDKRMPLDKIYYQLNNLKNFSKEIIYEEKIKEDIYLSIIGFKSKKRGLALWLIAGVHGEEPAGVNAIAKNISFINNLSKKIPVVVLPLLNPKGYMMDWRYPSKKRATKKGHNNSVGDSEHLLLNIKDYRKPRKNKPSCSESMNISDYVVRTSKTHPPLLVIDFHEDESLKKTYIFSQGKYNKKDPVAISIVTILKNNGFKLIKNGKTRCNEPIINGIVSNVKDGSIDELLATDKIVINGKLVRKNKAKSVIVVETNTLNYPLKKRVKVHSIILKKSKIFYDNIKKL